MLLIYKSIYFTNAEVEDERLSITKIENECFVMEVASKSISGKGKNLLLLELLLMRLDLIPSPHHD